MIKKISYEKRKNPGSTLVEFLLYIAIAGFILLGTSMLLSLFLQSRTKNQTVAEVSQQGIQIIQNITQTIRNAQSINSPGPGASDTTLSVNSINAINNPTIFDLSGNQLRSTKGSGATIALTSSRIEVSNLLFQNVARLNAPDIIRIQFTLTYQNPSGRNEYSFSQNFWGTASPRSY